ncbi:MAG: hypothetical protein LAT68_00910 [Cyclobacteriaceae bacterium]|nr:hypothetical protein [Cyclobacteriaceae bacterium]MCH8514863.1 hypothetical protein [Cyclobacteriaceae bacterium]
MPVKHTKHYLNKLEDLFAESDYILRYERGSFKSGYCVIRDSKVVVVNKFFDTEGRINCLIDILKQIEPSEEGFSEKNKKFYAELKQTELEF